MNTPLIFWIISWILITVFCLKYLHSILSGETKPHIYTIVLYVIITAIIFYSQITINAGFWAMYVGITCVFWILIFFLSFKYWIKDITISDKIALLWAILSIPLWYFSWSPLLSIILLMVVDIFSSYPTVRKTYVDPYSENLYVFIIEFIWIFFSLLALASISFISAWYLIYIMIFDVLMFLIVCYRRQIVQQAK